MFVQARLHLFAPKPQNENLLSRHVRRRGLDITFQFRHLAGHQADALKQLHWARVEALAGSALLGARLSQPGAVPRPFGI